MEEADAMELRDFAANSRFTLASTVRIITSMRDRISALFGGERLVAMP
jgi:hypothetical protein